MAEMIAGVILLAAFMFVVVELIDRFVGMNDGRIHCSAVAWNPFCFGVVGYDGGLMHERQYHVYPIRDSDDCGSPCTGLPDLGLVRCKKEEPGWQLN